MQLQKYEEEWTWQFDLWPIVGLVHSDCAKGHSWPPMIGDSTVTNWITWKMTNFLAKFVCWGFWGWELGRLRSPELNLQDNFCSFLLGRICHFLHSTKVTRWPETVTFFNVSKVFSALNHWKDSWLHNRTFPLVFGISWWFTTTKWSPRTNEQEIYLGTLSYGKKQQHICD